MKVIVLGGGTSNERAVSLRSSQAVADALKAAHHEVEFVDPQDGYDFLTGLTAPVMIFPILHGTEGEDGGVQARLEAANIPFLGTKSEQSAKCFDKWQTRELMAADGMAIPEGYQVTRATYAACPLVSQPHVLKAARSGSSLGVYVVRDPSNLNQGKIDEVFALGEEAIVEELVEGTEITVPILDGTALPVIEIRPPQGVEFDYENKYNGATQELCPPQTVDDAMQVAAQRLAERVHRLLDCRHLSRVDIIIRPSGELVVLEINTMPGMTDQSLYPKSAQVAGFTFPQLTHRFVELVARDYQLQMESQ